MKIKVKEKTYEEVMEIAERPPLKPKRPSRFFRQLMQRVSAPELKKVGFTCNEIHMERLEKDEPCLILMNHSSFIDLKIAAVLLKDRPFHIVCTSDGFIGKSGLMQNLGCIPTNKFITDPVLVKSMVYATRNLQDSILMYPEASYSFDGTATPLPDSIGKCIKLLKIPVVMIQTYGAFLRDPLYNGLQLRDVRVSADMEYLLGREDIQKMSAAELTARIKEKFSFDNFRWQKEQQVKVEEPFRADYLNRVLYRCPCCQTEGKMLGRGITLTCQECHKSYELTEYGELKATEGETEFTSIPDWYQWQRQSVKEELAQNLYHLEVDVEIYIMRDMEALYHVGNGRLEHSTGGFHLSGCGGKLDFAMLPSSSYSLYADYYWYELGDMICIGDSHTLYYCFPQCDQDVVAKTRLATEELYKMEKEKKTAK